MAFYDYCVLADSDLQAVSKRAAELGWGGICLLGSGPAPAPPKVRGLDAFTGLLIEERKQPGVRKAAAVNRKRHELIVVRGIDEDINRTATETPQVDVLLPAPGTRIDYKMAKFARQNGVAIGFEFTPLLRSSGRERGEIFSVMAENASLVIKFGAPFVLTSGALSEWDLRAPGELAAFGKALGFGQPATAEALSGGLIGTNRKKLGGKWVSPGVEVE